MIDRRLLDAVQRDATLTHDQLADRVGASASAVQRRLTRLKQSRTIIATRAIVDPKAVGRIMLFVVGLEIERKSRELYAKLQQWIAAHEAVQQAYNVTGSSDFIAIISTSTLEEYDALMEGMIAANPNIRKYTTSVVLQSFKQDTLVPVLSRVGEVPNPHAAIVAP